MACIEYDGPVTFELAPDMEETMTGMLTSKSVRRFSLRGQGHHHGGYMLPPALKAAERLASKKVSSRVLNVHTIKPLDEEAILKAARETKGIVVAEEHSVIGGLGGAVAELVTKGHPTHVRRVGIEDTFCGIGPTEELMAYHGLTDEKIYQEAMGILRDRRSARR
jgi:deoxyxylulose-5-phosphate synthase